MHRNENVAVAIGKGAVAGGVAMWVMTQATTWMYEHEDEQARRREDRARGDRTAYEIGAEKAAGAAGVGLSEEQRGRAGLAIHWATGIGSGIAYALLRRRVPAVTAARGLVFGTAVYLAIDEVLNPALGLTPGPQAFPWQTHARGLGGHLVFGLANDLLLHGLDRAA
jgi:uncharacterized membrane protein YagU involved in acid resistance